LHRRSCIGCALVLLSVAVDAQLPEPSSLPANLGKQVFYRALPKAWLRLAIRFPPPGSPQDRAVTTIELLAVSDREWLIAAKYFRTPSDVASQLTDRTLAFEAVPTIQPVLLRFTVRAKDGRVVGSHTTSYRLRFPDEMRMLAVGPVRALDESGYLGDFIVDQVSGDVVRTQNGG
jgi:hypothetical protein